MMIIVEKPEDRDRVIRQIQQLNHEKKWRIDIKPYKLNRSSSQNALYWKWITIIGIDLGWEKDELHAFFANKFLTCKSLIMFGQKVNVIPSTSWLKVDEFSEYLKRIERFANEELGMTLPNRDDLYFEAMCDDSAS